MRTVLLIGALAFVFSCGGEMVDFETDELLQMGKGGKPGGGEDPVCPEGKKPKKGKCVNDESQCSDGLDNDSNGLIDCDDSSCDYAEACQAPPPPPPPADCFEGMIDNGYGCVADATQCTDGIDNDGNGLVDCQEAYCQLLVSCPTEWSSAKCLGYIEYYTCYGPIPDLEPGNCTDGLDNDGNGTTDCDDPNCMLSYFDPNTGESVGSPCINPPPIIP